MTYIRNHTVILLGKRYQKLAHVFPLLSLFRANSFKSVKRLGSVWSKFGLIHLPYKCYPANHNTDFHYSNFKMFNGMWLFAP